MKYSPRFKLVPTMEQAEAMDWTRDTTRQLYNHAFNEFNQIPKDAGTLRQRVWRIRDTLPAMKEWLPDLKQVYSTVVQKAVGRIRDTIQNLGKLKAKGYNVGSLNWKKPRVQEFHLPSIRLRTRQEKWPRRTRTPRIQETQRRTREAALL